MNKNEIGGLLSVWRGNVNVKITVEFPFSFSSERLQCVTLSDSTQAFKLELAKYLKVQFNSKVL